MSDLIPIYMIINTYDKQSIFAKLIYLQYHKLLDSTSINFIYRIPYNSKNSLTYDYFKDKTDVQLIKSPRPIKATIRELLRGLDRSQMVYWAIDDRIPVNIDTENFLKLYQYIQNINKSMKGKDVYEWIGRFSTHYHKSDFHLKEMGKPVKVGDFTYSPLIFRSLHQRFWKHHFINVGLMEYLFLNKQIPETAGPGWLARHLKKYENKKLQLPYHVRQLCNSNYFPLGDAILVEQIESCIGRENKVKDGEKRIMIPFVTKEAKIILDEYGFEVPNFDESDVFVGAGTQYLKTLV